MRLHFRSIWERKTGYLLAILFALLALSPLGYVYAQTAPESGATIDLQTDNDDDGLPDALVAEIDHLLALSATGENGADVQSAALTLDAAMADFTARLPYSEQTRAAQAEAETLMARLNAPHSEAEEEALQAQLRAVEARMLADPNFALATDALQTLFLRQLRAKAVADGAQFVTANPEGEAGAASVSATWPTTEGDIMFINSNSGIPDPNFIYAMGFSHIGTFDGDTFIYDSNNGKGVQRQDMQGTNWDANKSLIAYAHNNQKSNSQVQGALQWAKNRYGTDGTTGYTLDFTRKVDDTYGSGYRVYCSQLVWKIHDHINSDLDSDHPTIRAFLKAYWGSIGEQVAINGVAPDEIAMDSNITFYRWISPQGNESPKVYIPDVRLQHNNWRTRLVIRNNSNADTTVRVVTTDADGVILNTVVKEGLKPDAGWSVNLEEGGLHSNNISDMYGAAMVFAGADVSAVAYHKRDFGAGQEAFTSYAGVESPQTTMHVPLVQRGNVGWYNYIAIQNTHLNNSANVTLAFTPSTAGNSCTKSYTLPARGHLLLNTKDNGSGNTEFSCLGSKFVGSVKITASRPLAVAYTQYLNSGETIIASTNSAGTGGNAYAPVIQNQNFGYTSGFSLLNASSSSGSPSVTYYDADGQCVSNSYTIGGNHSTIVYPAPPSGNSCDPVNSAYFSGNGRQIGVQVNQIKPGTYQGSDYPAITQPGTEIVAPILWRNWNGYSSGLAIQNTSTTSSAYVTITYYDQSNGNQKTSESVTIEPLETATIYPIKPNAFRGSAVISSNRPVAVVVNHLDGLSGGKDGLASHIGLRQ